METRFQSPEQYRFDQKSSLCFPLVWSPPVQLLINCMELEQHLIVECSHLVVSTPEVFAGEIEQKVGQAIALIGCHALSNIKRSVLWLAGPATV